MLMLVALYLAQKQVQMVMEAKNDVVRRGGTVGRIINRPGKRPFTCCVADKFAPVKLKRTPRDRATAIKLLEDRQAA